MSPFISKIGRLHAYMGLDEGSTHQRVKQTWEQDAASQAFTVRTAWVMLHLLIMATVLATNIDRHFSWVAYRHVRA